MSRRPPAVPDSFAPHTAERVQRLVLIIGQHLAASDGVGPQIAFLQGTNVWYAAVEQ